MTDLRSEVQRRSRDERVARKRGESSVSTSSASLGCADKGRGTVVDGNALDSRLGDVVDLDIRDKGTAELKESGRAREETDGRLGRNLGESDESDT